MKTEEVMKKKIAESEKKMLELNKSGDLKKLDASEKNNIAKFYEEKSRNRLQTAKLIYEISANEKLKKGIPKEYSDYAEAVASSYYAMYYIVHSYLAAVYGTKLRDDMRVLSKMNGKNLIFPTINSHFLAICDSFLPFYRQYFNF